jgi:hypothetical protein
MPASLRTFDGRSVRVLSATFKRAVLQMDWWLARTRTILASTQNAVEWFVRTEQELNAILSKLEPKDGIDPTPAKTVLPKLDTPPAGAASSYASFDPRKLDAPKPKAMA